MYKVSTRLGKLQEFQTEAEAYDFATRVAERNPNEVIYVYKDGELMSQFAAVPQENEHQQKTYPNDYVRDLVRRAQVQVKLQQLRQDYFNLIQVASSIAIQRPLTEDEKAGILNGITGINVSEELVQ
jgi:hypothetical protein